VIGISLGDMVHRVVAQLPERIVAKAKVVQPIGGSGCRLRVPAAKPLGSCSRSATMSPGAPRTCRTALPAGGRPASFWHGILRSVVDVKAPSMRGPRQRGTARSR